MPRYRIGSVICEKGNPLGARRWVVIGVLSTQYRVRMAFKAVREPMRGLWDFALCEAFTELESQNDDEGVIDSVGVCHRIKEEGT